MSRKTGTLNNNKHKMQVYIPLPVLGKLVELAIKNNIVENRMASRLGAPLPTKVASLMLSKALGYRQMDKQTSDKYLNLAEQFLRNELHVEYEDLFDE